MRSATWHAGIGFALFLSVIKAFTDYSFKIYDNVLTVNQCGLQIVIHDFEKFTSLLQNHAAGGEVIFDIVTLNRGLDLYLFELLNDSNRALVSLIQ
jgi:hypothetical protein